MDEMSSENFESYSIEEIPSDRRTFTRFQPDDQVRQTLIVSRKQEYPATIVNFSATGCDLVLARFWVFNQPSLALNSVNHSMSKDSLWVAFTTTSSKLSDIRR